MKEHVSECRVELEILVNEMDGDCSMKMTINLLQSDVGIDKGGHRDGRFPEQKTGQ
jgi:hypothetical protein